MRNALDRSNRDRHLVCVLVKILNTSPKTQTKTFFPEEKNDLHCILKLAKENAMVI